tara:strand:+ start:64 stop:1308 length:1245 start_codon:yes stop_codon:yes gene_type:complete
MNIFKINKMNKIAAVDLRFLLLAAMLVFLPGVEALKNIFAFLFVLSWVLVSKKNNNWGGKWQIIDTILLLWILADIFVSINAVITHQLPGSNFRDVIRFVLIAWVLSRIYFSKEKLNILALISVVATVITLAYSYYSTGGTLKELHSVGHINHTAIFLLIAYAISLSLLLFEFNNLKKYQKIILFLTTITLFYATIDTNSRAAFGLINVVTLINFIYLVIRLRKFYFAVIFSGFVFIIGFIFWNNPPLALERMMEKEHILYDSARVKINNFSYYAFKENPILGIGFGNYGQLENGDIQDSVIRDQGVFDSSQFIASSHAHNVYFNYLVSGGILIFSIFLWFWAYIAWIIMRLFFLPSSEKWIILSSISVFLINLIIGLFNTTLHHEHAILSMFVLGLLISRYRLALYSNNFHQN